MKILLLILLLPGSILLAASPQECIVTTVTDDGRGASFVGTGAHVNLDGLHGVLTVNHNLQGYNARVRWPDGTTTRGKSTNDKYGHDLGFIHATNPNVPKLQISPTPPRNGEVAYFYGDKGRSWTARLTDTNMLHQWQTNHQVTQGDSGGPVVNQHGYIIGVIAFGTGQGYSTGGPITYTGGSGGPDFQTTHAFAKRLTAKFLTQRPPDT